MRVCVFLCMRVCACVCVCVCVHARVYYVCMYVTNTALYSVHVQVVRAYAHAFNSWEKHIQCAGGANIVEIFD